MSRLIDEAELKEWVENWFYQNKYYHPYSKSNSIPCSELYDIFERMPTIDAVEVVRCKDCCYWDRKTIRHNCNDFICWNEAVCEEHSIGGNEQHEMWTDADWFCADGERRDNE